MSGSMCQSRATSDIFMRRHPELSMVSYFPPCKASKIPAQPRSHPSFPSWEYFKFWIKCVKVCRNHSLVMISSMGTEGI